MAAICNSYRTSMSAGSWDLLQGLGVIGVFLFPWKLEIYGKLAGNWEEILGVLPHL